LNGKSKKSTMTFVLGNKVRLMPFADADITDAYVGWLNDPVTMRFSNQRFLRHDRQSSQRYLATFSESPNLFFSVRVQSTEQVIGTMTAYISPMHGTADMGILIGNRSAWGQGFGLDAWTTLMHHLLLQPNIRKVTAGTLACNVPMLSLAARSGMKPDGVRQRQELVDGVAQDILYFAKFADDRT
jgi:[ribosomal protein S5]-alanine N-acetyltransferase